MPELEGKRGKKEEGMRSIEKKKKKKKRGTRGKEKIRMQKMKMRKKSSRKIKLGKRRKFAATSLATTIASSELGEKGANSTILKFALNSKRVDRDLMVVHVAGTAKISIKKSAEVHFRGAPVVDPRGPATLSTQGSKGMEIVVAESFITATIF